MISVLEGHEALRHLEEVAIGLVGREVHVEDMDGIGADLLLRWQHLEWVLHHLPSGLVKDGQECPVDRDREPELVFKRQLA